MNPDTIVLVFCKWVSQRHYEKMRLLPILRQVSRTGRAQMHNKYVRFIGSAKETVPITFIEGEGGERIEVDAPVGKSVLDVALDFDIDIEGACGGELACSTCHVILSQELFDSLPPKEEEEEDMLDLAWGLTDTSRLCCQIKVSQVIEGAEFLVPDETNNML